MYQIQLRAQAKLKKISVCLQSNPPIVLENTSNVHTAGTKTHPDSPPSAPATPSSQHRDANTSHMMKDQVKISDIVLAHLHTKEPYQLWFSPYIQQDVSSPVIGDTDSAVGCKDPEDIPTFDEWKRKVMEVEKEKSECALLQKCHMTYGIKLLYPWSFLYSSSLAQSIHTANSASSHPGKKVQKNFNNYASVECGAKVLGSNPEAKVLHIPKDNPHCYGICGMVKYGLIFNLIPAEHFSHFDGEHGHVHA